MRNINHISDGPREFEILGNRTKFSALESFSHLTPTPLHTQRVVQYLE
jgi:hypothetical protein